MRRINKVLPIILAISFIGVGCSDSDPAPTGPSPTPTPTPPTPTPPTPPPPGTSTFSGSWDATSEDEVGTPRHRWVITQNGGTLTGDAYWRWRGVLERVGPITGTIAADGAFEWTAVLNDNGWEGSETVTGTFTGATTSRSGAAVLSSAGPTILWKWFALDGSLNQERTTQIENPPTVFPTHGEGPVGEAGLWRGSVLFSSPGNCNAQGFAVTMGLEGSEGLFDRIPGDDDNFVGALSARRLPYDGVVDLSGADNFADFLGPIGGSVDGGLFFQPDTHISFTMRILDGPLSGQFTGELQQNPQTPARLAGGFVLDRPGCRDDFGLHDNGLFILLAERQIVDDS